MPVIHHADARRTTTPNAVMTTYASAGQGGSGIALWCVEMAPAAAGPPHRFDVEQVWTVLDGAAEIDLDGERHAVGPGDTVVMPADVPRRVHADADAGLTAVVASPSGARAIPADGEPVVPPWVR